MSTPPTPGMPTREVTIYTDGACEGNPGPGGWAAVLSSGKHRKEVSGGEAATTNNRMELLASIEALAVLKEPCRVSLHTDSQYLRDGITRWLAGWKRNGWLTRERKPVRNEDLWRRLDAAAATHKVAWHWVKGHAGHEHNERCDRLAVAEIARLRTQHTAADLRAELERFRLRQAGQSPLALL